MKRDGLGFYRFLSGLPLRTTFQAKVLAVSLVGTGFPLILLAFLTVSDSGLQRAPLWLVLTLVLLGTVAGTAATIAALTQLLEPVRLTSEMLVKYRASGAQAPLPTQFDDEAGHLMRAAHETVAHLDHALHDLENLTNTDPLTGAHSRRFCASRLLEDLSRASRSGIPVSIALLDLDRFKAVNDTHGHEAGDRCLRHLVNVIRSQVRDGDWISRWGGDEFVLLFWKADATEAKQVVERIRAALADAPLQLDEERCTLRVSAGICGFNGLDEPKVLLAKADSALLEAKREGRDGCLLYSERGAA